MLATGPSLVGRVLGLLRRWWPVAAFLLPVLVAQTVWSSQYDLAGHAADHLQSATPVFPMAFLSAVLLWALPGRSRRDPVLWLLLTAAIASCLVVLAGNVRVIDAAGQPGVSPLHRSGRRRGRPGGLGRSGALTSTRAEPRVQPQLRVLRWATESTADLILTGKQTGLGWYGPVFTPARRPRRGHFD